jgi:hypothetical protein
MLVNRTENICYILWDVMANSTEALNRSQKAVFTFLYSSLFRKRRGFHGVSKVARLNGAT